MLDSFPTRARCPYARATHIIRSDRLLQFGGGDSGPAPGALLLVALAARISAQDAEHAAGRGIDLGNL